MRDLGRLGRLHAAMLAGAWRVRPDPPTLSPEELAGILPLLLSSGVGGLGWWRVRGSSLASTPMGDALRQAYRLHSLRVALKEDDTRRAISALRAAGAEPLLLKGWAVSRLYPERGLRPYGDIDVLVRAEEFETATEVLAGSPRLNTTVELHPRLGDVVGSSTAELLGRSRLTSMDGFEVRVLGPEDQLRYLCLHLVKHAARRSLHLADIGLLLEAIPPGFDWDYFLRGSNLQIEWSAAVLKLAHVVLGAELDAVPSWIRNRRLPGWLVRDVLHQWGIGMRRYYMYHAEHYLRAPRQLHMAVLDRWPNAIETTVWSGVPVNDLPRLPLQLLYFLYRAAIFPGDASVRLLRRLSSPASAGGVWVSGIDVSHEHTALYAADSWDSA